jgi:hypothetical protein
MPVVACGTCQRAAGTLSMVSSRFLMNSLPPRTRGIKRLSDRKQSRSKSPRAGSLRQDGLSRWNRRSLPILRLLPALEVLQVSARPLRNTGCSRRPSRSWPTSTRPVGSWRRVERSERASVLWSSTSGRVKSGRRGFSFLFLPRGDPLRRWLMASLPVRRAGTRTIPNELRVCSSRHRSTSLRAYRPAETTASIVPGAFPSRRLFTKM